LRTLLAYEGVSETSKQFAHVIGFTAFERKANERDFYNDKLVSKDSFIMSKKHKGSGAEKIAL
jgi:hypothetical protein